MSSGASRSSQRFRFGTSSWSDANWVGPFYPPGTRPAEFLSAYATRFDTVEADVTYYRIPSAGMVTGWTRKTPAAFTLCAKFPRSIVHAGEGPRPNADRLLVLSELREELDEYLGMMSLLGPKCGPLVLQFPYFNKQAFASPEPFLERLDAFLAALPRGFRYAVEIRNRTWLKGELLELLRGHGVALVWVDLVYMPHPAGLAKEFDIATADFGYVRLIGDRKRVESATGTMDRVVIDQRPRLERWAEFLRALPPDVEEVFAFANNHYAGHGPATIRELAALIRGERPAEQGGTVAGELPF